MVATYLDCPQPPAIFVIQPHPLTPQSATVSSNTFEMQSIPMLTAKIDSSSINQFCLTLDTAIIRVALVNKSKSLVLYAGATISPRLLPLFERPPNNGSLETRTLWNGPHSNCPARHKTNPNITSITTSKGGEDVSGRSATSASDR